MARSKLPEETVVRIVECPGYGCSVEATADICEVDPRTVGALLSKAGPRAEDFHRLQLDRLAEPIQAVEIDELHAPLSQPEKGGEPGDSFASASRRRRGSTWIHVALAAASRYVIELRLGPRTLESAWELLTSVAACCRPRQPLLIERTNIALIRKPSSTCLE